MISSAQPGHFIQNILRQHPLALQRPLDNAVAGNQAGDVCIHAKARAGLGYIIGHDQIQIFPLQLPLGVLQHMIRFCGESDQDPPAQLPG